MPSVYTMGPVYHVSVCQCAISVCPVYTRGPVYGVSVCPVCHQCTQCTLSVYVQYTLATLSLGLGCLVRVVKTSKVMMLERLLKASVCNFYQNFNIHFNLCSFSCTPSLNEVSSQSAYRLPLAFSKASGFRNSR